MVPALNSYRIQAKTVYKKGKDAIKQIFYQISTGLFGREIKKWSAGFLPALFFRYGFSGY